MFSLKSDWLVHPFGYDVDVVGPTLHKMVLTSEGVAFVRPLRTAGPRRVRGVPLPSEYDLDDDPVAHGRRAAAEPNGGSSRDGTSAPAHAGSSAVEAADADVASDAESDMFGFGDMDAMFRDDIIELIAFGREMPGPLPPAAAPEFAHDDDDDHELGTVDIEELHEELAHAIVEIGEPTEADDGGGDPLLVPFPTPAECADAAIVDADGWISCGLEPFARRHYVGRITVYPANAPDARKNVAIRCTLHGKCSFVRRRMNVSNRRLLEWLFHGAPFQEGGPSADDLAAAHARLAIVML